jgi:uncharacterized protein YjbJ (UPF0337 family)
MSGTEDRIKGKAKEMQGEVTNDPDRRTEGQMDQAKGKAKDALDKMKDAAHDVTR